MYSDNWSVQFNQVFEVEMATVLCTMDYCGIPFSPTQGNQWSMARVGSRSPGGSLLLLSPVAAKCRNLESVMKWLRVREW